MRKPLYIHTGVATLYPFLPTTASMVTYHFLLLYCYFAISILQMKFTHQYKRLPFSVLPLHSPEHFILQNNQPATVYHHDQEHIIFQTFYSCISSATASKTSNQSLDSPHSSTKLPNRPHSRCAFYSPPLLLSSPFSPLPNRTSMSATRTPTPM